MGIGYVFVMKKKPQLNRTQPLDKTHFLYVNIFQKQNNSTNESINLMQEGSQNSTINNINHIFKNFHY